MIEVFAFIGGLLLALVIRDLRRMARARRERTEMRHIVGAREWWGKR